MPLAKTIRRRLRKRLTGADDITLEATIPDVRRAFDDIDDLGIYLHIPFCRKICPYCPYNKTLFRADLAERYVDAVRREIDHLAGIVGDRRVTSLYVGGGTPTTMVGRGLDRMLRHVLDTFDVTCGAHMESHPTDLDQETIEALRAMGVEHLSIGVESMQDRHLRALRRPYAAADAARAVRRAVNGGFRCVNTDMMFALPGQAVDEVAETARALLDLGIDQCAAYPLFNFPHTSNNNGEEPPPAGPRSLLRRRRMLRAIERICYGAGFRRTSVWAFTRPNVPAYCSVTVPLYLGLGASGGSYLRDLFYLNTFDVREYVEAMEHGRSPIALSLDLTEQMQMAGWLYWRVYATRFRRADFGARFGTEYDTIYGRQTRLLRALGLVRDDGEEIALTDAGAYWLHVMQDLFSIDGVGKLWSTAMSEPWPEAVPL
jgi:coproporphyrinogen III oxidase-like Fe-S oxidoreductase